MPTIDSYTATDASALDTDDALVLSVDNVTKKILISELKKLVNTLDEVAVSGTTYTLLSTDQGKIVRATNAAAKTFTVPATSGFLLGVPVIVRNAGTADLTLSAASGVTVNGSSLVIEQNKAFSLIPRATDEWDVNI